MSKITDRKHSVAVITGELFLKEYGVDAPLESLGEVDTMSISHSQVFTDVRGARDPNRPLLAHVPRETDITLALNSKTFDNAILKRVLMGSDSGAQNSGTVTDEAAKAYPGSYIFTEFPGISAVAITAGATPLVLNTDFEVDAASGRIHFLPASAVIVNTAGHTVAVSYAYAAYAGTVSALTETQKDYEFILDGYNLADSNKPVIVRIPKAAMEIAKQLALLGTENAALDWEGRILIDGNSAPYTITRK